MATDSDGVVLLIGSGLRPYRQYLMEQASQRYPLWLIDETEPTWQRSWSAGSTVVALADELRQIPDQQGLVDAAVRVSRERPVLGAFTYDELLVLPTAEITERLGLRGLSALAAARCRDKHQTRRALTAAGLPQPRFALAGTAAEARAAADAIGYPVVAKPLGMGASAGVVRADDRAGLDHAYRTAERASRFGPVAYAGAVLIEELIDGPEISVDGAVVDGGYHGYCLARKQTGMPPYFEELGHLVDGADPLLDDAGLQDVLARGHLALGVRDGMTHTEVRLTGRGPVIIEVNARLGGGLIPYLGQLATGIEAGQVAADVAVGARPRLAPTMRRCAAIRFLYPAQHCRVLRICMPEPDPAAGLVRARALARAGDVLRLPPRAYLGRFGYLICTADDPGTCADRVAAAAKLTEIRCQPLDEPAAADERPW